MIAVSALAFKTFKDLFLLGGGGAFFYCVLFGPNRVFFKIYETHFTTTVQLKGNVIHYHSCGHKCCDYNIALVF